MWHSPASPFPLDCGFNFFVTEIGWWRARLKEDFMMVRLDGGELAWRRILWWSVFELTASPTQAFISIQSVSMISNDPHQLAESVSFRSDLSKFIHMDWPSSISFLFPIVLDCHKIQRAWFIVNLFLCIVNQCFGIEYPMENSWTFLGKTCQSVLRNLITNLGFFLKFCPFCQQA